jgi:predicted nucleic acid-binding protein
MIFEGIIVDTDFLISFLFENQSTHQKALNIYEKNKETSQFIVLDIITFEFATTVSRLYDQKIAIEVVAKVIEMADVVLELDFQDKKKIWEEFNSYGKKGTSYFDCANLVMAKKLDCKIGSFDRVYPKEILA